MLDDVHENMKKIPIKKVVFTNSGTTSIYITKNKKEIGI
jgi:hypothetical protein